MNVSEDKLIEMLEKIRDKLEDNDLLEIEDDLTISILISHLEEIKESK